MTRRRVRGGLLLPLVLVAGGVILLLSNLGLLELDSWVSVVRLWPLLLIALGVDLMVERAPLGRALVAAVAFCVLLAAGLAAFHMFAPSTWVSKTQTVSYPLGEATAAVVELECDDCSIRIGGTSNPSLLVEGTAVTRADESLTQSVHRDRLATKYRLTSRPRFRIPFTADREGSPWQLSLHPTIPIELLVRTLGEAFVDLSRVRVTSVDISGPATRVVLVLPASVDSTCVLSGSDVTIRVPASLAVHLQGAGIERSSVPADYIATDTGFASPPLADQTASATIILRPGITSLHVEDAASE